MGIQNQGVKSVKRKFGNMLKILSTVNRILLFKKIKRVDLTKFCEPWTVFTGILDVFHIGTCMLNNIYVLFIISIFTLLQVHGPPHCEDEGHLHWPFPQQHSLRSSWKIGDFEQRLFMIYQISLHWTKMCIASWIKKFINSKNRVKVDILYEGYRKRL